MIAFNYIYLIGLYSKICKIDNNEVYEPSFTIPTSTKTIKHISITMTYSSTYYNSFMIYEITISTYINGELVHIFTDITSTGSYHITKIVSSSNKLQLLNNFQNSINNIWNGKLYYYSIYPKVLYIHLLLYSFAYIHANMICTVSNNRIFILYCCCI